MKAHNPGEAPRATMAPYDLPCDAVDLAYAASLPQFAEQPARVMDVAKSIDAGLDALAAAMSTVTNDHISQAIASQRASTDVQIASLVHRLEFVEVEVAGLRAANEGLQREVMLLERLNRDPAARKAAAKRKPKAKSSDAVGLPAFVRAGPVKRGAAIEAAPGAESAS